MFRPVSSKVDFPKEERRILSHWYKSGIVAKYLEKNKNSKKTFSFLDGPITANNPMAVHHAWGRTYKDLWQRFYNMMGFRQRFQNGFDCQGLWVEVEVERELGLNTKKDIENLIPGEKFASIAKFVELCKERVRKFSAIQTDQSKRLGYFMDWDNSYYTMSDENNYMIWYLLKRCFEKGYLYKGTDTVPWCPRCGTAISQHEILTEEYQKITHKGVYLKYPIKNRKKEYLLVWTTTPWTLLSNVSIAVNEKLSYLKVKKDKDLFYLAKTRLENILSGDYEVIEEFTGEKLVGLSYQGLYDDLPALSGIVHRVISGGEFVGEEEGSGLVHIAPGAGEEDFDLAQKEKFPVVPSIDEGACYLEGFGEFTGKNAKENPNLVLDDLGKRGFVLKIEDYTHRYPVCWRCKSELVWRVVDEWYIAMDRVDPEDKERRTLREQMKDVARKIEWLPDWGLERELDWLSNMQDWLISKKRYWGLALPIWECKKCLCFEVLGGKNELKEKAVEGWGEFEGKSPHRPWIDKVKIRCRKCGGTAERIPEVGNPWLDAGIVPFSTYLDPETGKVSYLTEKKYWREWFPADFITECFPGQFKNWFYSLIASSTILENTNPFKTVLGHGQVRDEKGEEMHKSKGNAVEFNEAAENIGVDVMRWLYLRTKPENNVNFGYHVAEEIRRLFLLPLWNVYLFFVTYANIDHWQPKVDKFSPTNLLDRWILSRLDGSLDNITSALDGLVTKRFDAADAIRAAENFIYDLSNWYVRRIRNRVGPTTLFSKDKNDAYKTLFVVLKEFACILAPIVPFISEEIYTNLTGQKSVHLAPWPIVNKNLRDENLEKEMDRARKICELAHSQRKAAKIKVRQPLALLTYNGKKLEKDLEIIIAEEINVKLLKNKKSQKEQVVLDLKITPELQAEGEAREIVRIIQERRKEEKAAFDDRIEVTLPDWPKKFEDYIKRETLAQNLKKGEEISIKKVAK
jgi:isoleucyl-tRNA synthetase